MTNINIPKTIHCCWLSGDPLPQIYKDCFDSWKKYMPDFEIVLWDKNKFDINSVEFVRQACESKKWAFAADYIRLYALYNHGGIYLDLDVMVYKSFEPFLIHSAFSSVEFNPIHFYPSINKGSNIGLAIEAAVIGAKKGHPWIKDIMKFYDDKKFINDPKYYIDFLLPRIMTKISMEDYGFKLVPLFQILDKGVILYPPDVFSSAYDVGLYDIDNSNIDWTKIADNNPIRFSYHICAHGWYEAKKPSGFVYFLKKSLICILGKKITNHLKKKYQKKIYY